MSTFNDLLHSVRTKIQGLGLTIGTAQIRVKKLPAVEENIDVLPCIIVCPASTPESINRNGFEQSVNVVYSIDVIVVAAGNMDFSDASIPTYLDWREQIRRQFQQAPLSSWANPDNNSYLYDVTISPMSAIDPFRVSQLYDYMGLQIKFHCSETSA